MTLFSKSPWRIVSFDGIRHMVREDQKECVWINRIRDRATWMISHEEYQRDWHPDQEQLQLIG